MNLEDFLNDDDNSFIDEKIKFNLIFSLLEITNHLDKLKIKMVLTPKNFILNKENNLLIFDNKNEENNSKDEKNLLYYFSIISCQIIKEEIIEESKIIQKENNQTILKKKLKNKLKII